MKTYLLTDKQNYIAGERLAWEIFLASQQTQENL